jgi:MFS family permease
MKAVPARKPESEHTGVERAMNRRVYLNPVLARRHLSKDSGRPLLGSTLLLSGEPGHGTEDVASMMPNQSIAASESSSTFRDDWVPSVAYRKRLLLVFLPFAGGYYLSYLCRSINAVISAELSSSMDLRASDLGLLTSVYFLSFAAMQLPIGIALDRYGPRRVQGVLLLLAAVGAAIFGAAHSLSAFVIGRALIGLGVAAALISGLKALVQWFPKERLPLLNGCFIMMGALGAVTATAPAELLVAWAGWRALFAVLAVATGACAALVVLASPEAPRDSAKPRCRGLLGLKIIYTDARFWRLAPLSTMCISTAWALQGLWAGPWLADVENLGHPEIVRHLLVMALALCGGAFVLGTAADRLRRRGVRMQMILVFVAITFILAQIALIVRLPVPSYAVWAMVASVGAATVLSFTIIAEYFPSEMNGQASAALNIFHIGGAFVLQYAIGLIIEIWGSNGGHYPPLAYQTAFAIVICFQLAAFIWFLSSEFLSVQAFHVMISSFRSPSTAKEPGVL